MIISNIGIKFIKNWEKFRGEAYLDQAGIWTIGYGITHYFDGSPVRESDTINETDATIYLITVCDSIGIKINKWITVGLKQYQTDALISLSYNIGTYAFQSSTILREINAKREIKEDYFLRWDKIHRDGLLIPSQGLRNRREAEWQVFSKGNYNVSSTK